MSVKNISKSLTTIKDINPSLRTKWKRDPNWLQLSTFAGSCYALLAILPESNYVTVYVSSTVYPCFVNWQDGTVSTVNSAGNYSRTYDYNSFDPSNSTLITHDGLTYKQAVVQIYGNGNVTINFNQNQGIGSPAGSSSANTTSNWLDIQSNGQDVNNAGPTNVIISSSSIACYHTMLERVEIKNPKNTTFDYLFSNCANLRQVNIIGSTTTVTSAAYMFNGCYSLEQAPSFDTLNVTSMSNMFSGCTSLEQVPYYNTALVNDMNSMFTGGYSLITVPLYNTASVTNMSSMFNGCLGLKTIPFFNTANVTNMQSMFQNCYSLQSVPNFNTVKVTNTSSMFSACYSLITVPSFNFASPSAISMSGMFNTCYSLVSIGNINTTNCNSFNIMFNNCTNLKIIPTLVINTSSVSSMFQGCRSLSTIPALNFLNGGLTNTFSNCNSLSKILATNISGAINVASAKLSKSALETMFGNLYPGAFTCTITSNVGADVPISNTNSSTVGSNILTAQTSTTGLANGMWIIGTGTGITTGRAVTFTIATDIVTTTGAHGFNAGQKISFTAIAGTTGISINTFYYVVNVLSSTTFQIGTSFGGGTIDLTGSNGTGTMKWAAQIVDITGLTITLDAPMAAASTNTAKSFRYLYTSDAIMKGWTVTG